jgi:molecular chaperone DnaK (HSP70)
MSVFGVDLGCKNSTIGTARRGGVDIVVNEVSKRETASFVSLGDDNRWIGEAGLDKAVKASTNTVANVKRFIGMRADDARLAKEKKFNYVPTSADKDGRLMFDMDFNGESVSLYPEQILAMLMGQFRKYVATETKMAIESVKDCVVTVPVYYTMEQRKLTMQACEAAGLNCMSVVNETTAALIDYGIFRGSELPEKEEEGQHVALVDTGYSGTTITVAKFWRGHVRVLSHTYDDEVGTRDIDFALLQYFAAEIEKKYRVNVLENKRATLRVLQACDKVKCMLSANMLAPLNIECIMDVDVNFNDFNRTKMEEIIAPLIERMKFLCERAVANAGVEKSKIDNVECIGGGCRIGSFKQALIDAFDRQPRFTLNASESIAKGATIMSAVLSPLFQVREFVVYEKPLMPVCIGFQAPNPQVTSEVSFLPGVNKVVTVLREADYYPKVFELTFDMSTSFDLHVFYDETSDITKHIVGAHDAKRLLIGTYQIGAPGKGKTTTGEVKIKIRFNHAGLATVEAAWTTEKYEVEETVAADPAKKDAAATAAEKPAAAEGTDAAAAPAEPQKIKKEKTRRLDLACSAVAGVLGFTPEVVAQFAKTEAAMDKRDHTIIKTKEALNSLEACIFENRGNVQEASGDSLGAFMTASDRDKFVSLANTFEQWLETEEGYAAKLEDLTSRLDQLQTILLPAKNRKRNYDDLPYNFGVFEKAAVAQRDLAIAKIGKAEHITEQELRDVAAKVDAAIKAMKEAVDGERSGDKTSTPATTNDTLEAKLKDITKDVKAVVNKKAPPPPPKKEEAKPAEDAAAAANGGAADAGAAKTEGEEAKTEDEGPKVQNDMD